MTQFNPKGPTTEQAQNYLGYSQGAVAPKAREATVDRSSEVDVLGGIVQGIGDAFNLAVTATDQATQRDLKKQITDEVDDVRYDFGVDAATILDDSRQLGNPQPVPPEVRQAADKLDSLKSAVAQGKLTTSHYWARINSVARQLRTRYPAYREQIDQMTSQLVGTNPANALRSALQSEAQAAANTGDGLTEVQKFVNAQVKAGNPVPSAYWVNPESYDIFRMQKETYALTSRDNSIAADKANLELIDKKDKVFDQENFRVANADINLSIREILNPMVSSIGGTFEELSKKVIAGQQGTKYSAAEKDELRKQFGSTRSIIMAQVDSKLADYPYLKPEQKKQIRSAQLERFNNMEEALVNKDFGLLLDDVSRANLAVNEAYADLVTLDDVLMANALNKALPEPVMRAFYGDPETLTETKAAVANIMKRKVMGRGDALKDVVSETKNRAKGAIKDADYYDHLIGNVARMASDDRIPLEQFRNVAKSLYGPKNQGFLAQITSSERPDVLFRLSNPAVAKRMYALRDTEPQLWEQYKSWTFDSSAAVAKTLADSAREIRINRKFLDVNYDEKSRRFSVVPVDGRDSIRLTEDQNDMVNAGEYLLEDKATAERAIAKLNKFVSAVDSVIQTEGDSDGSKLRQYITSYMGFDPEAQKIGPDSEQLFKTINSTLWGNPNVAQNGRTQFPGRIGGLTRAPQDAPDFGPDFGDSKPVWYVEGRYNEETGETDQVVRVPPGATFSYANKLGKDGRVNMKQISRKEGSYIELEELQGLRQDFWKEVRDAKTEEEFEKKSKDYLELVDFINTAVANSPTEQVDIISPPRPTLATRP